MRHIVWLVLAIGLMACSSMSSPNSAPLPASSHVLSHPSHSTKPTPASSTCHENNGLPDPHCTPGAVNLSVTQADISSTICKRGWTATVRPSVSYTEALKIRQIVQYGYTDTSLSDYEEDHLIPLELGGSPTSPQNLWPEPHAGQFGSYTKDKAENTARAAVCSGSMTLAAAQHAFATDWETETNG